MFDSLLIANRGEIACRVIRTARELGIRTIAVFSEADRNALHAELADEAHCIGAAPARESYLCGDRIVELARERGAQAIHPGYGFLSENADFAEACEAAGIRFVGPPAEAIRAMGFKDEAKARMRRAGVPVVPGLEGELDRAALERAAEEIGFPLLVKAVAGGGGKGMRRVASADEFERALEGARREAASAFGDDRLLIEKWIERPRHVEVQVFGDSQGNVVHLFERDCSLQRRHQKVVEEAPAPGLSAAVRSGLWEAAVRAARAIDYVGAGTVEFVLDASGSLEAAPFYFIEMNTRLQVEHPVTEFITGTDLVEWQLRVASGEPLPCSQDEIEVRGHALEVRLYSENPSKKYLPSTGTLVALRFPEQRVGQRVEAGVREGDEVSVFYDPMIAKLVTHGADRAQALQRMSAALRELRVAGVATNAALLARICASDDFASGDVDTGFLERHAAELIPVATKATARVLALAALAYRLTQLTQLARTRHLSAWDAGDAFRLNLPATESFVLECAGERVELVCAHEGESLRVRRGDSDGEAVVRGTLTPRLVLLAEVDGERVEALVRRSGPELWLALEGESHRFVQHDPAAAASGAETAASRLLAGLPGRVSEVNAVAGARVRRGAVLVRLEAMKMEHLIVAPRDAVVARVAVEAGAQVEEGDLLVELEDK